MISKLLSRCCTDHKFVVCVEIVPVCKVKRADHQRERACFVFSLPQRCGNDESSHPWLSRQGACRMEQADCRAPEMKSWRPDGGMT
ncbi:hypothetical protein Ae201684P_018384 [Aphanomyces euteiches]|uniref:Uncharacterized protein n=1 Tax=Aphanomyces euteiches TaxID=100861 RepID=A0A6G0XVN0_9STRA|nr:hypothetical protein Ae201684_001080 [Aphanomyces euteiches]KAH9099368.1 hypothetical protein Ae201684P_018384 [Aphanomyces euteiches]